MGGDDNDDRIYVSKYEGHPPLDDSAETNRSTPRRAIMTASTNHHKTTYERAQQSSSNQVGSTLLYSNTGNTSQRRPPNRALRDQNSNNNNNKQQKQSSFRSMPSSAAAARSHHQHSASFQSSSLRSVEAGGPASSYSSSIGSGARHEHQQQQSAAFMTSMSGNPLHRLYSDGQGDHHPGELELDKKELRQLVIPNDETSYYYNQLLLLRGGGNFVVDNESVALQGTTNPNNSSSLVVTPITLASSTFNESSAYTSSSTSRSDNNRLVNQIVKLTQLQKFHRLIFLTILFTLMSIGTFLTIQNVIQVKDESAWIEPNSDKSSGIINNWSMGNDAPQPIQGTSKISTNIQDYIADWAIGTTFIPGIVDNYGSISLTDTTKFRDIPLFWGTEYSDAKGVGGGNSMMESVLGGCLNLIQVSSQGVEIVENNNMNGSGGGLDANVGVGIAGDNSGGGSNSHSGVVEDYLHLSVIMSMGRKYINVDTTTKEGIERAKVLALSSSGMADVIYTSLLQDVSSVFTTLNQGRMFVLFRHPVEREMARFRYLRVGSYAETKLTDWQRGKLQDMSYEEYARSEFARENWMTRELVNKRCINGKDEHGEEACAPLEETDVHTAKEILRLKALIGLYSDLIGAVRHYGRYFGWDNAQKGKSFEDATMSCFQSQIMEGMRKDALGGQDLDPNDAIEHSNAYAALLEKNRFDFELFTYAQTLYKYQIELS